MTLSEELTAGGREARRREQARERERRYRLRHPEKVRAKKRRHYDVHCEEIQERNRRYYAEHREQCQESARSYAAAHRSEKQEYNKHYQAAHREQLLERGRQRYAARRAYYLEKARQYGAADRDKRPCVDCGKPCRGGRRECVAEPRCRACSAQYYRGERKGAYKGGSTTAQGYRVVFVDGRVRPEHRLVWMAAHGPPKRGWVVHHLNGDKLDNRLRNLMAMPLQAHCKLHKMIAAGAFTLHQAAAEARQMMGKAPTLAEALKTLRAQYKGDPRKQASYERKLLKPGWAGRMSPVERTYVCQVLYKATRKLLEATPRLERIGRPSAGPMRVEAVV